MGVIIDTSLAEGYMRECIALAYEAVQTGNYPLGSMVVKDGKVLAASSSILAQSYDPTAHPEVSVIRTACNQQQSRYLEGAILVSTLEPCPMCTAAAIWARFDGVVYGAEQEDALAWRERNPQSQFSWRQISTKSKDIAVAGDPKLWIKGAVLHQDCIKLFDLTAHLNKTSA